MTETTETQLSPPLEANSEVHTFLFADVRGYTRFTQERGDQAAAALVAKFLALMRDGVQSRGGQLVEIRGDEALAVFGSARQALRAAIELQSRFRAETEADPSLPLPVGMGIEMGEAVRFEGGFRGEALNLAARLCNLAQPSEILTTEGVVYLGRRLDGVRYVDRGGAVQIKGLDEPVRVLRVVRQDESLAALSEPQPESSLPIGTYLGALPTGVLVGREAEWTHIMEALDEASKGLGRLLLLSGEPGVGKTRLAQEVTLKAQHWGFLVATGRCYEPEQAVPFYPFLEALGAIYNAASAALRAEIPRRWPYLARLLPEQIGAIPESVIHGEEDQQWLFRAVTHLLTTMAEDMPIAILLDDLHWVDDSSLKLIQHLARYTRGSRILLLGTYRDVEIQRQHPLERMLLDLSREGLLDELGIRRLDKKDTAGLMSEMLGHDEDMSDLVDLVHERTGGNAFFVQEMVHALVENGSVFRRDGHWERRRVEEMEVPKSVRSVIGQRLSRLSEDGQEVLREASVLGQEFTFDDILELLRAVPSGDDDARQRWSEDEIDEVLRTARLAGLVREKDGDVFAFNHALTQQTLYAELSTRRRKRLHLAAGRALERLSEKVLKRRSPELAWHFLEGDDPEQAYRYALMAGEQSEAVFANGEAEKHYRTGLELARELDDEEREAEALELLGGVLTLTAKYDKALDLLERSAKLYAELGNGESERCVLAKIGHAHHQQGSWRKGIERLQPVVNALDYQPDEVAPSVGYAAVYASLARLYNPAERWREMLAASERAVQLARAVADTRILIAAEITRTAALWELGQEEDALRSIEEVIPRAETAGDITNLTLAWSYAAMYYARRGEFEKDRTYHERALELAERRGDRGQTVLQLMNLSSNYFHIGDWCQAKAYLERAEGIMRDLPVSRMTTWPTAARAFLCLRQGDLEEASKHARDLISHAKAMASEEWSRQGLRILAEAALLDQRPAEAQQHLEQALEDKNWEADPGFLRTMASAQLELGRLTEASDMSSRAVAQARAYRDQPELVESLVVRGAVLGRQESWDEAAETFEYALAGAHAMQFPFGEARAMTEYGRLYIMRGSAERGREYLENAIEIFKQLGARRDEALAESCLSQLAAVGD